MNYLKNVLKRGAALLLLLALLVSVFGCTKSEPQPSEPTPATGTFLAGTKLNGIDLSGKTPEQAAALLKQTAEDYTLQVTLDGVLFRLDAARLGLAYNEKTDLAALLTAQEADASKLTFEDDALFTFADEDALRTALLTGRTEALAQQPPESTDETEPTEPSEPEEEVLQLDDPTRAHLLFDTEKGEFVGVDGAPGLSTDYTEAVAKVQKALRTLARWTVVRSQQKQVAEGEKAEGNARLAKAVEDANSYLNISLSYSFTPDGKDTSYEYIDRDRIAQWLLIQSDGLTIELNREAISTYVNGVVQRHSVGGSPVQFKTTYGSYISLNSYRGGQSVNGDALYDDIIDCLSSRTGGSRVAKFNAAQAGGGVEDYGGSYVELDLTNQMAYCYRNYKLVISSPMISGSPYYDCATPGGVYTIKSKDSNRYLTGPGYKVWVQTFMPFNGGIGLHDCNWHSVFGGTRYFYKGSHGCINLPPEVALTIRDNVSVGTHVIVYGGIYNVQGKDQIWTGTEHYNVTPDATPFKLDMRADDNAVLSSYTSSDPSVCTVTSDGVVTVVGEGTCTITIESEGTVIYYNDEKTVTITVAKLEQTITAKDSLTLRPGDKASAAAGVSTGSALSYTSSDPKVAIVGADGTVTAVGYGTCTITVSAAETPKYKAAEKKITVTVEKKAQQLTGTAAYNCKTGDAAFRLDVIALDGAALRYVSDNPAVCTVDAAGNVTVVGEGTCTITVTAAETADYQKGTFTVTVTVAPAATEPTVPSESENP